MDLANAAWLETPSEWEDYNPVLPAAVTQPPVALPVKTYTPWPTLAPKYWVPIADFSDGMSALAMQTSGERTVFTRGAGFMVTWPEAVGEMEPAFIYNAGLSHITGVGSWAVTTQTGIKGQEGLGREGRYILASATGNLANQGRKKLAVKVISSWAAR